MIVMGHHVVALPRMLLKYKYKLSKKQHFSFHALFIEPENAKLSGGGVNLSTEGLFLARAPYLNGVR